MAALWYVGHIGRYQVPRDLRGLSGGALFLRHFPRRFKRIEYRVACFSVHLLYLSEYPFYVLTMGCGLVWTELDLLLIACQLCIAQYVALLLIA